jgi:hypothetical protein
MKHITPYIMIGWLVMIGWDWRLRTVACTSLMFIPGWYAMWTMVWWSWLRLSPNLSTRALWQPPVLSGGPVSRDISGSHQYRPVFLPSKTTLERVRGDENLVYPSPWDIKRSLTCRKILRYGTSGFTSHLKESVLRILSPLRIHCLGRLQSLNLWV